VKTAKRSLQTAFSSLSRLGIGIGLCAIAALVAIWAHFFIDRHQERAITLSHAAAETASLAATFREHLRLTLSAIDQLMVGMMNDHAEDPDGYRLPDWVERSAFLRGLTLQVTLVGPDGRVRQSSLGPEGHGVDLSDRPHIRHHRHEGAAQPYISAPVLGRVSGRWSIQITRRLESREGAFEGVLVISVDPTYFAQFFDQVQLGADGFAMVVGQDRVVRSLQGRPEDGIGWTIPASDNLFTALRRAPTGTFDGRVGLDRVDRIVSYAALADFPLVASIGRSKAEVLARFHEDLRSHAIVAAIFSAAVLALAVLLVREVARSRAQAARVADHAKLLDTVLAVTPAAISVKDDEGRLLLVNEAMARVIGRPRDEVEGRFMHDIYPPAAQADVSLWDKLARRQPNTMVTGERVTPVDGVPRHFLSTRQACEIGGRTLVVASATDITLIREAEVAMQRAAESEAAARIKSNFLANMNHELRTPLNAMIGFSEVIKDEMLGSVGSKTYRDYAENIHASGLHLLGLVNDVLDLTRTEAHSLDMSLVDVDLAEIFAAVGRITELQARQAGVTISFDAGARQVKADALRLQQVILNLVSNAVKFTAAGGTVRVEAQARGDGVQISVADTGRGMSAEQVDVALQPFGQVTAAFTRDHDGINVGLPLSKRLVEMMHGHLRIDSAPGRGTRVLVRLPQASAHAHRVA
jgi:PAS domain S-box-containing protein